MSEVTICSKLSVKAIGGRPRQAATSDKPVFVGRFVGIATGVKTGEDAKGQQWTAVTGDFLATGPDGEQFRSGKMFLPAGIHEQLVSAVLKSDGQPIEFGLDIYAVQAQNPIGYSYTAKKLIDRPAEDPLLRLADSLPKALEHKAEKPKTK